MALKIIKNIIGFFYFIYFNKIAKKNIIFLFHDVNNSPSAYVKKNNLNISKKNFEIIISHISKNFRTIKPNNIKSNLQNNYALITFDDGYKSYIQNAIPFLMKKKISSLLFLNSEVSIKKKLNINAEIDFLSQTKNFIKFMKENKIDYPYSLNINPRIYKKYINKNKNNLKKIKKKIFKYQGKFLDFSDLKELEKNKFVFFGNHLFNHWNLKPLKANDIKSLYFKNKILLQNFQSYSDYFAIPNGKLNSCYNKNNLKVLKNCKSKKIFSSNNLATNDLSKFNIDRVSIENIDANIFFIYFKIFKSRFINKFL